MRCHAKNAPAIVGAGLLAVLAHACVTSEAQVPDWIWHPDTNAPPNDGQVVYLRKTFRTPPLLWNARLTVSADDEAEVFLNGVSVGWCRGWNYPVRSEVSVRLNQGENVLAIRAPTRPGLVACSCI
jgi:hypothetical protein